MCMFCRSLFVFLYFFLLVIVLSVLLRSTDSDYPFGIFKLFLENMTTLFIIISSNTMKNKTEKIPHGRNSSKIQSKNRIRSERQNRIRSERQNRIRSERQNRMRSERQNRYL